jgi:hypothetical protein
LAIGFDRVEEKRFMKIFDDSANDGFASRFIFGFSETVVNSKDMEEWDAPAEHISVTFGETTSLDDSLADVTQPYIEQLRLHIVKGWGDTKEAYIRTVVDFFPGAQWLFKKVMTMIACVNLHDELTMEDFNAALAFMKWQAEVRKVFRPSQADDSPQARFQEMVLGAIQKADQKIAGKPLADRTINVRRLSQQNHWSRSATTLGLEKTIYALHACGDLKLDYEKDTKGEDIKGRLDWVHVKAVHVRTDCWCGGNHE